MPDTTFEMCSNCMSEVEMPADEVIKCPICGADLYPCSTCWDEKDNIKSCDWKLESGCWRFSQKQKGPSTLPSQTGHEENQSNSIIAENHISDKVLGEICDGDLATVNPVIMIMRRLCRVSDLLKEGA